MLNLALSFTVLPQNDSRKLWQNQKLPFVPPCPIDFLVRQRLHKSMAFSSGFMSQRRPEVALSFTLSSLLGLDEPSPLSTTYVSIQVHPPSLFVPFPLCLFTRTFSDFSCSAAQSCSISSSFFKTTVQSPAAISEMFWLILSCIPWTAELISACSHSFLVHSFAFYITLTSLSSGELSCGRCLQEGAVVEDELSRVHGLSWICLSKYFWYLEAVLAWIDLAAVFFLVSNSFHFLLLGSWSLAGWSGSENVGVDRKKQTGKHSTKLSVQI